MTTQEYLQLGFGQYFWYYSLNGEGIKDHLWATIGSTWYMLDANTGNWILTLTNVPGGTGVTDQNGGILRYDYDPSTGRYMAWNLTQAIPPAGPTGTEEQQWEPMVGRTINAVNNTIWTEYGPDPLNPRTPWYEDDIRPRTGYSMNITGTADLPSSIQVLSDENNTPKLIVHTYLPLLLRWGSSDQVFNIAVANIEYNAVPMEPFPDKPASQNWNQGQKVTLQWDKEFTYPLGGNRTWGLGPMSYEEKVFTLWCKESRQWWGYSLDNGALLWGPTDSQSGWNMFTTNGNGRYAYGNIYSGYYGGVLYAHDITTGEELWNYTLEGIGSESPYGDYQITHRAIADGKIYISSTEHSPTQPLWRGSYLRCIDAYTGEELWKQLNFVSGLSLADGVIVAGNNYDNLMYAYGKGPSATTINVPQPSVQEGSSIMILGTVTDQSPGAKDTPAIADESMDAWMDYLYMKQAMPTDAVGVTVKLSTYDPNGNYQDIGTTTVDQHGNFGKSWMPAVPGDYYILAEFEGSESYGSSSATTYITVDETLEATPPPEATPAPPTETYIAGSTIAILAAIAVVAFLLLRKK